MVQRTTRRRCLAAIAGTGTLPLAGCQILGGSDGADPFGGCREPESGRTHEYDLTWGAWVRGGARTHATDPSRHAYKPSLELDEPIEFGTDAPHRIEVENADTCRRLVLDPTGPTREITQFGFMEIYRGDGTLRDELAITVADETGGRNDHDDPVEVLGSEDTFASSDPIDRYAVRLLREETVVAATDPSHLAIGYPGDPTIEPADDGTAIVRCTKAEEVQTDWIVECRFQGFDGRAEDVTSPVADHEGAFELSTQELAYEDVEDYTISIESEERTIARILSSGID